MPESERVSVQTYVSADQRDRWRDEAEARDMSLAEYVRTMVQAGRRDFDLENGGEPERVDATPGVEGINRRVLEALRSGPADWEALLDEVTADLEDRLEGTLDELQSEDRIRYSGRHGGYVRVDDE
jgi:hypothetical protein